MSRPPDAGPPPSPSTQAVDRAAARLHARHLARGRALLRRKQYHPAIVELANALEAWPDEPQALTALGEAAFLAGDLDSAESATRAAVAAAQEPALKAAALWQLAQVSDKRGDRAGARS